MRISMVCHGNIARSQVLQRFLDQSLRQRGVPAELYSCGTAPREAYPDEDALLADVQRELSSRGLCATVERTCWSKEAAKTIEQSDIILVADEDRRRDILTRTGVNPAKVHLFYGFIGEGAKDFVDTYDSAKGRQDPDRYRACFDELKRIADLAADRIECSPQMLEQT